MLKYLLILMFSVYQPTNKRLLLLYADHASNPALVEQRSLLNADKTGLSERDLDIRIYIKDKQPQTFNDKHIKEPFTLILVGKDGSEKLMQHKPLTTEKLFAIVDAMPMRKQEMKKKP